MAATDKAFNFSAKLEELDKITAALDDDIDLDEGIKQYEQGMKLIQELKTYLATQTNRIEEIKKTYATAQNGSPEAEPAVSADEVDLDDIPF